MTKNEFYTNVANGNLTDETRAYAQNEIDKFAEAEAEKNAKNATLIEAILAYLKTCSEAVRAHEIAEAVDISTSKVTSLCKKLTADGTLVRDSIVFDKRSVYVYKLA